MWIIILSILISIPNTIDITEEDNEIIEDVFRETEYDLTDGPDLRHTRATESFGGYTLFPPMASTDTYLIDGNGDIVHTWPSAYHPKNSAYLLEDGNLLRPFDPGISTLDGGGGVQIISKDGSVIWQYEHYSNTYCMHHDVAILPNGNVLMIAFEVKPYVDCVQAGRDPELLDDNELWPEYIIEVEPTGATTGDIVWEWHFWDHMIQDFDITKDNYGVVEDHPELLDINYVRNPNNALADWIHFNSIDYNEQLDQILLTARHTDEIYIIDHSTTTLEAAGHTGGNSGMGGDILYRWGNPRTYRAGDESDRKLFNQHDANWIDPGCPGEGNILIFNNGWQRPGEFFSSIDEITPPFYVNGSYQLTPGSAYEPSSLTWTYEAPNPPDFYAYYISGSQRLPNGNTQICHGPDGHFFEVTPDNVTVWEYSNTFPSPSQNDVFKINCYAPNYPGLEEIIPSLTLSEGWNLISIPVIQFEQDLNNVLEPIQGSYDAVQWYDNTDIVEQWKHYNNGKTFGNDLFTLSEMKGFWVHITQPGGTKFFYNGIESDRDVLIQLYIGWNLVGFPSLGDKDRTAGLNNLVFDVDVDAIWTFDSTLQTWDEIGVSDPFKIGQGYWIHAKTDCPWVVPL